MPLQATSGAASYDAFGGGGAAVEPNYIESVFSTYLYTGTGATQTITNGIDLSTEGGLVWIKARDEALTHALFDTNRGIHELLASNTTAGNDNKNTSLTAFNTNGFTLGSAYEVNELAAPNKYASWTFRKQPKFFDVVTYTGNGTTNDVAHALGSVPGMVIIKKTSTTSNWYTLNRDSSGNYVQGYLNTTGSLPQVWVAANTSTYLTSTTLKIASLASVSGEDMNANGTTYVAYLFAHDAGGFGLTGTDNVISCGSYTGNGSSTGPVVTLGYEPQWVMWKKSDSGTESWHIRDVMRGMPVTASGRDLYADSSSAEGGTTNEGLIPTATGLQVIGTNSNANANGGTYIYIAIRRGPMAVPTTGTSVFAVNYGNNLTGAGTILNSSMLVDMYIQKGWSSGTGGFTQDRLRSPNNFLSTSDTAAEATSGAWLLDQNTGVGYGTSRDLSQRIGWMFRRAPSFFDEVCYTGTGSATTFNHNLAAVPELMIVKRRSTLRSWAVYNFFNTATDFMSLNLTTASAADSSLWNNTAPTSSVFTVNNAQAVNTSGSTYVAYLFATCAGVSKVGSYTGNGSSQTINCGFTGGARFVMVKATSTTGDWMVADSARGIIAGSDPYLELNNTNAEVTGEDWLDTDSTGFVVNEVSGSNANTNGATYIFLAIA